MVQPHSSKIIDIDFENKRKVNDGIYLLSPQMDRNIIIPNCVVQSFNGTALVVISNVSDTDEILPAGSKLGIYEDTKDISFSPTKLNEFDEELSNESTDESGPDESLDPDDYITTIKFSLGEIKVGKQLTESERKELIDLLIRFKDVMAFDGRLGRTNLIEFSIDIDRSKPVHVPPYRVAPQQREDIIKQAEEMLRQGIIEPCRSPWSSPIILIKKAESKGGGYRFVNDFRLINKLAKKWVYELPLAKDYFRSLAGFNIFCTLDAMQCFHQIPVRVEDRDVTAFIVPNYGSFRYTSMPMGMSSGPQHFMALMDICLGQLKYNTCLTFLDDILIPAINFDSLMKRLTLVLTALRDAGITLKPLKCIFGAPKLRFLGHVIDKKGLQVDYKKIKAIAEMPRPKSARGIRQFLGSCLYYSEYIDNFALIAAPLYDLTKTDQIFEWKDEHEKAFNELKKAMSTPPILVHYNQNYETELRTDACKIGVAYRLMQLQPNNLWQPVSYGSRKLKDAETRYPITELEALAVIEGLKKNRQYLLGIKFTIVTDHKALKALLTKKELPPRISRWLLILMEFQFAEIVHRPGKQMNEEDLLSRHPVDSEAPDLEALPDETFFAITDSDQIPIYEDYLNGQQNDPEIKAILDSIQTDSQVSQTHVIRNELLYTYRKDRLVLELPKVLIPNILYSHHDHPFSGHHSYEKTYQRIAERFNFKNMRKIVKEYCQSCLDCLTRRRPGGKPYGFMQIPKAANPAEKYFVDFLGPFKTSDNGMKYVFVCVDSFTRYVETAATKDCKAETVINFLMDNIITRHGMFFMLISDRAKSFTSDLMKNFAERLGFSHVFTTSFHPQSNISERVNASIANMLSNYCATNHKDWNLMLSSITLALNTQYHRSIDTTPFFLLYARHCVLPGDLVSDSQPINTRISLWKSACNLARKRTELVQQYNKTQYDKKRQAMKFSIGDKIMLYSPNRKVGNTKKLEHFWHGPYTIIDIKSPLVYEIQLSPTRTDVVHVDRMKKFYERTPINTSSQRPSTSFRRPRQPTILSETNTNPQTNPTPRPRPQHRYNTRLHVRNPFLFLMFILIIGQVFSFDFTEPVQWKTSDRTIVTEIIPYNFKVKFQSPCFVYQLNNTKNAILFEWCDMIFRESFINPLQEHCVNYDLIREKRILPMVIGAGVVLALGGATVGSYFGYFKTKAMEGKLRKFKNELTVIHHSLVAGQEIDGHLRKALEIVGENYNRSALIRAGDRNEFSSDAAFSAYLALKMAEMKIVISLATKNTGLFKLNDDFLKILNTSLPCNETCPLRLTTVINCHLDQSRNRLDFGVLTRRPSKKSNYFKISFFYTLL